MSQSLYPPDRPQTTGEVLDTSFRIFRVSLIKCLPLGVLAVLAGQIPNIYTIVAGEPNLQPFGGGWQWWSLYVLGLWLTYFVQSTMLLRQVLIITGQPTSIIEEFLAAAKRMPALTFSVIIYFVAILIGWLMVIQGGLSTNVILALAGFLLIIPGIYLGILLSQFWAAVILKRKGPIGCFLYSAHLVRGNFWRLTAVLTVAFIIVVATYLIIGVIAGVLVSVTGAQDVAVAWAFTTVIVAVLGSLLAPLTTSFVIAIFGDLRVRKEGMDLEQRIAGAAAQS